jgi:hypothetical protein
MLFLVDVIDVFFCYDLWYMAWYLAYNVAFKPIENKETPCASRNNRCFGLLNV